MDRSLSFCRVKIAIPLHKIRLRLLHFDVALIICMGGALMLCGNTSYIHISMIAMSRYRYVQGSLSYTLKT